MKKKTAKKQLTRNDLLKAYIVIFPLICLGLFLLSVGSRQPESLNPGLITPDVNENHSVLLSEVLVGEVKEVRLPEPSYDPGLVTFLVVQNSLEQEITLPLDQLQTDSIVLRKCTDKCDDFQIYMQSEQYEARESYGSFSIIELADIKQGDVIKVITKANQQVSEDGTLVTLGTDISLLVERKS